MKPVTVSIEVPQPREEVYDFLDVLGNHEGFTNHFLVDWELSGPPRGVGARAHMRVKGPGVDDALDMEVVEADPPRMNAEESVSANGRRRTRGTYRLESLPGGGTSITFELAWLEAPSADRLGAPLTRAVVRRANARALRRLAERLAQPLMTEAGRHKVVVIGGGFGGLQAVSSLARAPVEVTLIDRRNFHLFQPLTYQIATGALSPEEVCYPLRAVFKRRRNVRVLLGDVTGVDLDARKVEVQPGVSDLGPQSIPYDSLIAAGGSRYSYFGHDEWQDVAREVKSLESAVAVRGQILSAFEAAELEPDEERRRAWLTFVVVGAGPTGVEMAGQIAELARDTLRRDFRTIDPREGRVLLVEIADRVLTSFPPSLSARAARSLEHLGVTPLLQRTVVDIDAQSVTIETPDEERERVSARTVIWAAGVTAASLARRLAAGTAADVDRAGRVTVEPDLTLPGHPEVFALGDMVRVRGEDGEVIPLPGVAPVAMQQGRYAAKVVRARLRGREQGPFRYRDKGNLATIGRARAVADLHAVRLSGFPAWVTWLVVHIWYLIGFENRLLVLIRWSFSFFNHGRGGRVIEDFEEGRSTAAPADASRVGSASGGSRPQADRTPGL